MTEKILILDNIRSANNVGSIFRTADAIGINKIFLCGYTPDPIDRFGRERDDINKAALGAEKSIKWEHSDNILNLIEKFKKDNYQIVSLEQHKKSIDYKKTPNKLEDKVVVVLGSEVDGVNKKVLEKSDLVCEIPMRGDKESLNVSVSAGIFLFRIFDN